MICYYSHPLPTGLKPRMKITLDSSPIDAPCCIKVTADNGQDLLIQTDWEFPGIASTFGFSLASVQRPGYGYPDYLRPACHHSRTDGTIACPDCGLTAGEFISAARAWLDSHDGLTADDPGYFHSNAYEKPEI